MVTEMSTILIEDISHVRFSAPDLGEMGAFLRDFGLIAAGESKEALFYRGAGTAPFLHATTRGAPGFAALGLRASNVDDLHVLARAEGASVEDLEAPGGGKVVCLRDPDGRLVEVVAGQTLATPLPVTPEAARNSTGVRARLRSSVKLQPGPAAVVRLGHAVLNVSNFAVAEAWYKARFGFITSDEIEVAPGVAIGAFLRCLHIGHTVTTHIYSHGEASLQSLMEWAARLENLAEADEPAQADYNQFHRGLDQLDNTTEALVVDVELTLRRLRDKNRAK